MTYKGENAFHIVNSQEDLYLRQLEEGLTETFILVKQNGPVYSSIRSDKCQREIDDKEKHG